MSLPSNVQFALDALNQVGARLKAAKASGDDVTSILQEYKILQTTLENVIRPLANSNKGTNFFWNVLAPVFERVMEKPERKKHDKEKKKWKKLIAAGGAPAAPAGEALAAPAAPAAPAAASVPADGEKKVSKSEMKRIEKAKKKAAAKAKNAAAKVAEAAKMAADGGGAATTTTTTTTTPRDGAGSGAERTTKSRRVESTSTSSTTAPAAALTKPMSSPSRTPVAGTIDPTRASQASVIQILTAAKLLGVNVQLGRFQTSTLFQKVPCYDVGNGTILAGSFAGELFLRCCCFFLFLLFLFRFFFLFSIFSILFNFCFKKMMMFEVCSSSCSFFFFFLPRTFADFQKKKKFFFFFFILSSSSSFFFLFLVFLQWSSTLHPSLPFHHQLFLLILNGKNGVHQHLHQYFVCIMYYICIDYEFIYISFFFLNILLN